MKMHTEKNMNKHKDTRKKWKKNAQKTRGKQKIKLRKIMNECNRQTKTQKTNRVK